MKHPNRNTCLGILCGLTAPEDDLIPYVAQHHSLSMWAYAKDHDEYSSDTIHDRGVLAIMLILWSVAVNCIGPLLTDWYNDYNDGKPMPYLTQYFLVILTDSVGQVVISFYFKLQHNRLIKICCFTDQTNYRQPPQIKWTGIGSCCGWAWSSIVRCYMNFWQTSYKIFFVFLPQAITVVFFAFVLYTFVTYQLWDFAGSFLLTIPSARILEMFKLATMWGLMAQFGAAHGLLENKRTKSGTGIGSHHKTPPLLFPLLELLRDAIKKEKLHEQEKKNDRTDYSDLFGSPEDKIHAPAGGINYQEDKGNIQHEQRPHRTVDFFHNEIDACCHLLNTAMERKDERRLRKAIEEADAILTARATDNGMAMRKLRSSLSKGKKELMIKELTNKYGAIACIWPPESVFEVDTHVPKGSDDEVANQRTNASKTVHDEGQLKCCHAHLSCFCPCCGYKKSNGERDQLLKDTVSKDVDIEMQSSSLNHGSSKVALESQRVSSGANEERLGAYKKLGNEDALGDWGIFLTHRDGIWPVGLPNQVNSSSMIPSNEIEVVLRLDSDTSAGKIYYQEESTILPQEGSGTDSKNIFLSEEEWEAFKVPLLREQVFSFTLNPLKQLAHHYNFFDENQKRAQKKKENFQHLTEHDHFYLNRNKREVQKQLDEISAYSHEQACCIPSM